MKAEYTYHFANGEKLSISVEESDHALLAEFDRQEYNNNRTARRRNSSLNAMKQDGSCFASDEDITKHLEVAETLAVLNKAIDSLLPEQIALINEVFYEEVRLASIAASEGVSKAAITQRMGRILNRLRNFLD